MRSLLLALNALLLLNGCTPENPQPRAGYGVPVGYPYDPYATYRDEFAYPADGQPQQQGIDDSQFFDTEEKKPQPPSTDTDSKGLKAVEDRNYSDAYMYPKDTKKQVQPVSVNATKPSDVTMTKRECIAMISQKNFDKYTTIFGSEEASIKRCQMIKSMQ